MYMLESFLGLASAGSRLALPTQPVRSTLNGQGWPQSERCGAHHAAQVPLPWLLGGAELLGCRYAEDSCPIGACPAKVVRTQGSLRLAMVRFIEGVEHAAMGAETLERHRDLAENDEHHALAMEASQLLDRHLGKLLWRR